MELIQRTHSARPAQRALQIPLCDQPGQSSALQRAFPQGAVGEYRAGSGRSLPATGRAKGEQLGKRERLHALVLAR